MSDLDGTEQIDTSASEPVDTSGPSETPDESAPSGGNPAWEPLRTALGPQFFQLAEPHLKEFDKQAQGRIAKLNSDLKTYSSLGTPEQLTQYATIAQRLDSQPEVIYEALGKFLRENGRMPETDAEVAEAVEDYEDDEEQIDPRIAQLEQTQMQMMQMIEAQQAQERAQAADAALDEELGQLRQAHPDLEDVDIHEILQRAAFRAMNGQDPALEEVAQEYIENVVNRIRSAPRAGDSAPRLLPTGGGSAPTGQKRPALGDMPKGDVQDLVASLLQQSKD